MIENTVLTDTHRVALATTSERMQRYWPEMFGRKIQDSMVQYAFAYQAVLDIQDTQQIDDYGLTVLAAGSHEDIATECLKIDGFSVTGVDPVWNCDLRTFAQRNLRKFKYVVSASVIEHTTNDEEFIADACDALVDGGYGVFTMDFKNDWTPGQRLPNTSNRFYTAYDLQVRLPAILTAHGCEVIGEQDYTQQDHFQWEGIPYSFASLVFRKK